MSTPDVRSPASRFSMLRPGLWGRPLPGRKRAGPPVALLVGLLMVLGVVAASGCANGTYPVDLFYEMHYQQSFGAHEPPRLTVPEGAVPVTGREIFGTENPIPSGERLEEGARLFVTNCAFCHGATGKGDGHVLRTMVDKYGNRYQAHPVLSPNLTSSELPTHAKGIATNDAVLFAWITNGATVMPPFAKLLSVEERWLLVNYIRSLPD